MTELHFSAQKVFILALMISNFAGFIWSAVRFFKTGDSSAQKGKQLVSLAGLGSMVLQLFLTLLLDQDSSPMGFGISTVLYGTGLALFWWSITTAQKSGGLNFALSEHSSKAIIAHGPYRYLRHPIYTSYSLVWLAGFVYTQQVIALLPFLAMGAFYVFAAKKEEAQFLGGPLREGYKNYQNQTGMFLPKLKI